MLPVKLSESMTSGSQMRGGFGCLVDLGLFGLAWIFPPLWFVIIPLWCYEGIVGLREYYYKYKMNVFLRNELSRMTCQELSLIHI